MSRSPCITISCYWTYNTFCRSASDYIDKSLYISAIIMKLSIYIVSSSPHSNQFRVCLVSGINNVHLMSPSCWHGSHTHRHTHTACSIQFPIAYIYSFMMRVVISFWQTNARLLRPAHLYGIVSVWVRLRSIWWEHMLTCGATVDIMCSCIRFSDR